MQGVEKFRFSRIEAAFSLGLSIRSIDYLVSTRRLDSRRDGGRILIPRESLRRYASAHHTEPIRPRKETRKET
jgi:hypothetical protein